MKEGEKGATIGKKSEGESGCCVLMRGESDETNILSHTLCDKLSLTV